MAASATATAAGERSVLVDLLRFASGDAGELADRLIGAFGTAAAALTAAPDELGLVIDSSSAGRLVTAAQAAMRLVLARRLEARPVIGSPEALLAWARLEGAHLTHERISALFLNAANHVIGAETLAEGTVDVASLHVRTLVKRALLKPATAVILVHNHPSGDPTPSEQDLAVTRQARAALALVDVDLFDHLVIAAGGHVSMRAHGLL